MKSSASEPGLSDVCLTTDHAAISRPLLNRSGCRGTDLSWTRSHVVHDANGRVCLFVY